MPLQNAKKKSGSSSESTGFQERLLFLRRWWADPRSLGALFPSSRALSCVMAKAAFSLWQEQKEEYVLELGAGTGRFTQAMLDFGIPEDRLICVESDPQLAEYLTQKFPRVQIISGDACYLDKLISAEHYPKVGVVVSGLPMITLPEEVQRKIIEQSLKILKPDGSFLQFTYNLFPNIAYRKFGLEKRRLSFVLQNFPPATVWIYNRKVA